MQRSQPTCRSHSPLSPLAAHSPLSHPRPTCSTLSTCCTRSSLGAHSPLLQPTCLVSSTTGRVSVKFCGYSSQFLHLLLNCRPRCPLPCHPRDPFATQLSPHAALRSPISAKCSCRTRSPLTALKSHLPHWHPTRPHHTGSLLAVERTCRTRRPFTKLAAHSPQSQPTHPCRPRLPGRSRPTRSPLAALITLMLHPRPTSRNRSPLNVAHW